MVSRSFRSETLNGTRRLLNHRSQNQDKNYTEGRHYWTCLNRTGVEVPHHLSNHHVANQKLISNFFQRHNERRL